MSKSEDYLEQLLKGAAPENDILEEDILEEDTFEEDFLDEDFLKEFEMEMEKMEESEGDGDEADFASLFDDLDSILNGDKNPETENAVEEMLLAEPDAETVSFRESEVNFADLFATEKNTEDAAETSVAEDSFSFADLFAADTTESKDEVPQEDPDVLKILEGLDGIDLELDEVDMNQGADNQADFSALEGFLAASAAAGEEENTAMPGDISLDTLDFGDNAEAAPAEPNKKTDKKSKKAGEKGGFMNKLGLILFGEDEDEEVQNIVIGEASEEDLAGLVDITEKAKKEQKKKEKKEKREQAKQARKEKQEKAKQKKEQAKKAKPKKEKKPKPPKQPDNTPPLPKKPVFLIFLMVASLLALILMGADLLGYSNQMDNAKNHYAKKNYSEAFAEISGIEIKEEDMELYNKYHTMAMVSTELDAYDSLMSKGFYEMALDCLVRTIGRAEKYSVDAELYGCSKEMHELEQNAEAILNETFGLSREDALEFYAYRSKREYSVAIAKVIKELDLEKVTE